MEIIEVDSDDLPDVCCLNRPFDNQTQDRIRLESEAILLILAGCETGKWYLLGSEVIDYEVSVTPDPERKEKVGVFTKLAHEKIKVDEGVNKRANYFVSLGFKPFDALHLACAESVVAEVLLTTDDKFLSKAKKNKNKLRVRVENPVIWGSSLNRVGNAIKPAKITTNWARKN